MTASAAPRSPFDAETLARGVSIVLTSSSGVFARAGAIAESESAVITAVSKPTRGLLGLKIISLFCQFEAVVAM